MDWNPFMIKFCTTIPDPREEILSLIFRYIVITCCILPVSVWMYVWSFPYLYSSWAMFFVYTVILLIRYENFIFYIIKHHRKTQRPVSGFNSRGRRFAGWFPPMHKKYSVLIGCWVGGSHIGFGNHTSIFLSSNYFCWGTCDPSQCD